MTDLLFQPLTIRETVFKNRIAMSPMCMHSGTPDGRTTDFHVVHYGARALGGAGLVMLESTSVLPNGILGPGDIGIWDDSHIEGLSQVARTIQRFGAKAGAQIGHSGRQLDAPELKSIAPSPIPFTPESRIPEEMTLQEIREVVEAFQQSARRAREASFDVLEVHTAHGYLLNQFLSPLSNKRTDLYGGNHENRYRIVREILDVVRKEWTGPLFVRISSTDYVDEGNTPEDFVIFGSWMKEQGVDLIDCSSGGIAPVQVHTYPNYQVTAAELIRNEVNIKTGAVGLIQTGRQAEELLQNKRADMVFVGREMLKDPFWPRTAADDIKATISAPAQYTRYGSVWQRTISANEPAPMEATLEK